MIGCIIQARTGSTRLPSKIMMSIDQNDTVLSFGIKQVKSCKKIDELVIATTDLPEDDIIVDYMNKLNIKYFRGSSKDVLDRYYQCAKKFSFSEIVRITADNPLIDYEIVDTVVKYFKLNNYDYIATDLPFKTFHRTYPLGYDVEVFTFSALENAWKNAKLPSEREHVTPFMKKNKEIFKLYNLENNKKIPIYRLTIDRNEDLEFLRAIAANITKQPILMEDVYQLFLQKPEILDLYNGMNIVEGYSKSLKEDEEFLKKMNKNGKKNNLKSFKETVENN